jgi:hypothetical protein
LLKLIVKWKDYGNRGDDKGLDTNRQQSKKFYKNIDEIGELMKIRFLFGHLEYLVIDYP